MSRPELFPTQKKRSLLQQILESSRGESEFPTPQLPQQAPQPMDEIPRPDALPEPAVAAPRPPLADPYGQKIQDANAKLTAMDATPSRKQTLLSAITQAAPIAIGGLFGGSVGASGAAQGVDAERADQEKRADTRRKTLQEQVKDLQGLGERRDERQMTVDAQMQAIDQRAQAAAATAQNAAEKNQILAEAAAAKEALSRELATAKGQAATSAQNLSARKSGLKLGENGQFVPIGEEDMSETEKNVEAFKKAQTELEQARTLSEQAKSDPNSPVYKMVQQRLLTAQQNAATAAGRLGLSTLQTNSRIFGRDSQGAPIPGAMITDSGETVGSTYSQNVRPTGTERNKADLANSAHEQIQSMKGIVQARPDIFGPIEGRSTDFSAWVGSQDPDAQRFRAARTIAGDHLAGVFGGRSEAALSALDDAIGHFKDNPAAVMAGLDQLDKANDSFVKAGAVKSVGSNAATGAGTKIRVIDPKTKKVGSIPFEDWPQAQKEGFTKAK